MSNKFIIIVIERLSIIFCLYPGDLYLFWGICLGIFWSFLFVTVSEVFDILWCFDIPLLYYFNISSSITSCLSFWRYTSFFRYFSIIFICNCLKIILLWVFLNFRNSISNLINNQITKFLLLFFELVFLKQF